MNYLETSVFWRWRLRELGAGASQRGECGGCGPVGTKQGVTQLLGLTSQKLGGQKVTVPGGAKPRPIHTPAGDRISGEDVVRVSVVRTQGLHSAKTPSQST